ncbi:ATP-binding protein [Micromonospora purpureochromogenes]|uniref:ATP-binding protein n=1 Tax=Micromonospora purpureochromogenes TaxID=47872 RepID=UPI0033FA71D4
MAQLRTSPPSSQATELRRWQLSSAADLRGLRASLHQALTGEELLAGEKLDEVPELMVLVASELATNALRHGIPPTIVRLLVAEDRFILEVADHDLSTIPELVDTRPMGAGGRGLQIAEAVSLDVGWYATDRTKIIWAAFPRS